MNKENLSFVASCKSQGKRITGPRKIIANVISSAHDHPDALEIHRRANAIDKGISLSTVYRTLKLFAEIGLIEQHTFEGSRSRVESAAGQHHDHLIDVDTGKIIEFNSDEIEQMQKEIALKFGFELIGHRLELYGRALKK